MIISVNHLSELNITGLGHVTGIGFDIGITEVIFKKQVIRSTELDVSVVIWLIIINDFLKT